MGFIVLAVLVMAALMADPCTGISAADPPALAMAAPLVAGSEKVARGKAEDNRIRRACAELRKIVQVLDKPKPTQVIQQLPRNTEKTAAELQAATGIPGSTLHGVLNTLWSYGLVYKTLERPARYGRTEFLEYVLSIGERIERRILDIPPASDVVVRTSDAEGLKESGVAG